MGFYPKHLKQRRHRWTMRVIATAALSGATFVGIASGQLNPARYRMRAATAWFVRFPDGKESHVWTTKRVAAEVYLAWWFDKQNIWPRYR